MTQKQPKYGILKCRDCGFMQPMENDTCQKCSVAFYDLNEGVKTNTRYVFSRHIPKPSEFIADRNRNYYII